MSGPEPNGDNLDLEEIEAQRRADDEARRLAHAAWRRGRDRAGITVPPEPLPPKSVERRATAEEAKTVPDGRRGPHPWN